MKSSDKMEDVRTSKDLKKIEDMTPNIVNVARTIVLENEEDRLKATDRLTEVSKALKEIEKIRKQFVKPIKDSAKAIDNFFKEKAAPLKEADELFRSKIGAYLDQQDRLIRQQEAAEQRDHEKKVERSDRFGTKKPEAPVAIAPPPKMAAASARKILVIEILNIHRVPSKYLVVSESAVKAAWKDGITNIAGLKLTEKNALTVR